MTASIKHLVLGGTRSGKSRFAEQVAIEHSTRLTQPLIYLATATAQDAEMSARIQRHQQDRGDAWHLIEEPIEIQQALHALPCPSVVLIDCLTLWLTNCLGNTNVAWSILKEGFIQTLTTTDHTVVMVSNEISMGVIPMGELTRTFVDELGWLHQDISALSENVTLMTAGLPLTLK